MDDMIHELLERWNKVACDGMGSVLPGEVSFLELTKETFQLLFNLNSNQSVPNNVARILVLMQEVAVYCWFSDKTHCIEMWAIISTILYSFLNGFEQCGSVYPKLRLGTEHNIDFFDFDSNKLSDIEISNEPPF